MLDRVITFASVESQQSAAEPGIGRAWIKHERAVDDGDRGVDIFTKKAKRIGGTADRLGVIRAKPERLMSEFNGLVRGFGWIFDPTVRVLVNMDFCHKSERGRKSRVAFDRLRQQVQGIGKPLSLHYLAPPRLAARFSFTIRKSRLSRSTCRPVSRSASASSAAGTGWSRSAVPKRQKAAGLAALPR